MISQHFTKLLIKWSKVFKYIEQRLHSKHAENAHCFVLLFVITDCHPLPGRATGGKMWTPCQAGVQRPQVTQARGQHRDAQ